MKIPYTKIVGVESDEGSVLVSFRPQNSDSADKPLTVRVTPHDKYIHVHSCLGDQSINRIEHGPNTVNINFGPDNADGNLYYKRAYLQYL